MKVKVSIEIKSSKEKIWQAITDIESSKKMIKGIKTIEILEKPANRIVGLKWKETREIFGKEATEIMWITDAVEGEFYKTRAESHGNVYITTVQIDPLEKNYELSMELESTAQGFISQIMTVIVGFLFKRMTVKAMGEDLKDIKVYVEGNSTSQ